MPWGPPPRPRGHSTWSTPTRLSGPLCRYYRDHPDYAGEVDHAAPISELADYDGWALSTSADALPAVLALCPPGVRVAAWHRGARPHRDARGPLSGWEPVIYAGGRPRLDRYLSRAAEHDASPPGHHDGSTSIRPSDSLVYAARPRSTDRGLVTGAKPAVFCRWIFDLLGAQVGDRFVDLFPGSEGVGRAWTTFTAASLPEASATLIATPECEETPR